MSVRTRLFDNVFCCIEVQWRWLAVPALQCFKIIGAAIEGILVLAVIWEWGALAEDCSHSQLGHLR